MNFETTCEKDDRITGKLNLDDGHKGILKFLIIWQYFNRNLTLGYMFLASTVLKLIKNAHPIEVFKRIKIPNLLQITLKRSGNSNLVPIVLLTYLAILEVQLWFLLNPS